MRLGETIRIAFRSIWANKLRTFLTMLGIIIGVASVITLSAVGNGASDLVTKQVQGLGSNLLTISPGAATFGGINLGSGSDSSLTMADVQSIAQQDPDVGAVAPLSSHNGQVVFGPNNTSTSIQGTSANYLDVRTGSVAQGRFFSQPEVDHSANVAVLGSQTVQTLFTGTGADAVGQTIDINQIPFTIIGVLASQGSNGFTNLDDRVLIPITTYDNVLTGSQSVSSINVSAASAAVMSQAQAELESTLRAQHGLAPGQSDDFRIQNQASLLSTLTSVTTVLSELLAGVAGISLVVGGIGIMNIMLVSVTERTREIGIRKAIGAKRGVILAQFLVEAMIISVLGGIIGIVIGGGGSDLLGLVMHFGNVVSGSAVLLAIGFSLVEGIVFGVYPARKAARLNPIDALRHE